MPGIIRVLLADNHETLREQLQVFIDAAADLQVVGVVADGQAAVEASKRLRPDVVVMDLSMPVLDGLEATAQIHASCPEVRVVALTTHRDRSYVAAMQQAGGRGYVLKHSLMELLEEAVRVVAAGGTFLDPTLDGATPSADQARPGVPDRSPDVLSTEEQAVLQHTARGLTTAEVADTVGMSTAQVKELRARAMARLDLESRVALVRYAERHGWR